MFSDTFESLRTARLPVSTMPRVPKFLRPRLSFGYVFCSAAAAYAVYCLFGGLHFFSTKLPDYTGPYAVGAIDIEVPCDGRPFWEISEIRFKDSDDFAFTVCLYSTVFS